MTIIDELTEKHFQEQNWERHMEEVGRKFARKTVVVGLQVLCALKYRFGWKKSDKIHYYSELLGMKDTISEDDMLVDTTKTEIEKKLEKSEKKNDIMQERLQNMELQMAKILEVTNRLHMEVSA